MNLQEIVFETYVALVKAGRDGFPLDDILQDLQDMEAIDFITKYGNG